MKRLVFLFALLLIAVSLSAQTNYTQYNEYNTKYIAYENAMTDSTGNYYHQYDASGNYIYLNEFSNSASFLPIWITHSSTAGAVSMTSTLEGRTFNVATGQWNSWYTIDTLASASSTETQQEIVVGLAGGERPDQVRIKFDGQAGNRSDTKIYSEIKVLRDTKK